MLATEVASVGRPLHLANGQNGGGHNTSLNEIYRSEAGVNFLDLLPPTRISGISHCLPQYRKKVIVMGYRLYEEVHIFRRGLQSNS